MIFSSKNERGVCKAAWIASLPIGAHFVTRRIRPEPVGAVRAVQPGRGKKAVAFGKVVSCEPHSTWLAKAIVRLKNTFHFKPNSKFEPAKAIEMVDALYAADAALEGFETWSGLCAWFVDHGIEMNDCWRLEFEKTR